MKNFFQTTFCFALILGIFATIILPNPFLTHSFVQTDLQIINDFQDFEEVAQTQKTQKQATMLDWENCVNAIFDCFVSTKIFDFSTKKTFFVQRTGGIFHADVEPATPGDTKTLRDVLKKHTSSRIPVLIEINGMWVCASLSNNVHGFGLISNNELDGHLCLHFLGSKTTRKKFDPLHQKTVKEAYNLSKKIFPKN